MAHQFSRRSFLQSSASAGLFAAGLHVSGLPTVSAAGPNDKLNIAAIGVANKGGDNINNLASQNFVALCDVDENYLNEWGAKFPQARRYRDYRIMLEKEAKNIDAVVVSTADHTHAPASSVALDLGKHVYCEKPLAHTVAEARALTKLAAKNKLATQMGTQIHATDNYRRVVEIVQAGVIGKVSAVYNWCNKGWSDGRFHCGSVATPKHLDWDLWLGPAKSRPYCEKVHPADWRRFWEFGSGTFGDMACHVMDLPFWALGLRTPKAVSCTGPEVHADGAPAWAMATYEFEGAGGKPLMCYWADGGQNFDLVKQTNDYDGKSLASWGLGILFVGDKGMLAADYGRRQLLPKDKAQDFKIPEQTLAPSMGHWNEWVHACKTGAPTLCNFDYSGALTETVLLGIVAYRAGAGFKWNAEQLKASLPKAQEYVTKEYRKGFEVVGL